MKFRRCKKSVIFIVSIFILIILTASTVFAIESPYNSYNYSYWGEVNPSPEPFLFDKNISLYSPSDPFKYPTDMTITDNGEIIVTDSGSNRIVCLNDENGLNWQLKTFQNNGKTDSLNTPNSVFVKDGYYYVADTGNSRILKFDSKLNLVYEYKKPVIKILGDNFDYKPLKLMIDKSGYLCVISKNINQGLISLDQNGKFKGFLGAPKVVPNLSELILRIFSTKTMKNQMGQFVPTEYNSFDIDSNDFIYCITRTFNQSDMNNYIYSRRTDDQNAPIRKLNLSGTDVLIRNGIFPPVGDIRLPNIGMPGAPVLPSKILSGDQSIVESSTFADIKIIDSGIYYVLDNKRNRIFCYDSDGNTLFIFGGIGSRDGSFSDPVAIDVYKNQLYVLNSKNASIDIFKPTEYGTLILNSTKAYYNGDYKSSETSWKQILDKNINFEQAHNMLGKIDLRNGNYKSAMAEFKNGNNFNLYSKAMGYYRSEFVEKHFILIILAIIFIIFFLILIKKTIKKFSEKESLIGTIFKHARYVVYTIFHPFDSFYEIKHNKRENLIVALSLYFFTAISAILSASAKAFIFTTGDPKYTNLPFIVATTLLPLLFFAVSNWCFVTLMDGKGTFSDIITYTGYAQAPTVLINIPMVVVSYFITMQEAPIYNFFLSLSSLWTIVLLIIGTMVVHDYSLKKTILTLILTIVGIVVIIFLCLLFLNVIQQMTDFVSRFLQELSYR